MAFDPSLAQLQALLNAQSQQDQASLRGKLNSSLVRFGAVPTLPAQYQGLIDPATANLAQQNTLAGLSTTAQLEKENKWNQRRIPDLLAARGMLWSGERGFQLGEEQQRFKQATYNATQSLLDYLAGAQEAVAQAEQNRAMQMLQAQQDAAAREQDYQFRLAEANAAGQSYGDTGGGQSYDPSMFYDPSVGADPMTGAPAAPPGPKKPSPWQVKVAQNAAKLSAAQRTPAQKKAVQAVGAYRRAGGQ